VSRLRIGVRRTFVLCVGVVALLGGPSVAVAAPSEHAGRANFHAPPGNLEGDVTNSPNDINGEPHIAVNPRKPNNLVFTATVFAGNASIAPFAPCFVAYSMDRGETWTQATWPSGDRPACGDAEVTVDPEGTFYLGFNQLGCPQGVIEPFPGFCDSQLNHTAVSRSTDGGATWSPPVPMPLHVSARAHLQLDAKTGKLYAVGGLDFLFPSAISVSSDQGRTWSPAVPAVPTIPPCVPIPLPGAGCGPTPYLAVYDGIMATTEEGPSEVLFHVSQNDGKTFTTYPVTDSDGIPVPSVSVVGAPSVLFSFPEPLLAADATRPGRFAVMIPRGNPNRFEVYITNDAGRTWEGPTVISAPGAFHPAMEFGPLGFLGVMWRAGTNPAGGVNAFAAVSVDRGKSFSPPVQVNAVTEPINNSGQPPGDVGESGIAFGSGNVYVTWSDGRNCVPPSTDGIFARVPLFKFLTAR
jgi:hypothetical protein